MDKREGEDIERGGRIHRGLYKKYLMTQIIMMVLIPHLESDSLECKVKWTLEVSLGAKLVDVMEFQLSYFKSLKMMLLKCCTLYANKSGKLNSSHRTGKGQFSFQFPRKERPKCVLTATQLYSSHLL